MKILYAITKANWGGAQRYVFDLVTSLPKDEFEVKVAFGLAGQLETTLKKSGVGTIQIKNLERDVSILKDVGVFFELLKIFKKEKPDLVHLNSSKIGGLGALAARLAGIRKIIFTVHGFAFNENRPWIQKKIIGLLSWLTIVFSTDVIFISKTEYDRALTWPFIKRKAKLIHNGVESPVFLDQTQARFEISKILGVPENIFDNKTVVGTIAELTANKGLSYAIRAFKDLENCIYIIIGQGELGPKLKKEIADAKLEGKIYMAGFIANVPCLLKAFDIFLLPSIKEGLPYVLIEAGFAGLPVITTSVGGTQEVVTDQESGLVVPPKDSEAIKKAIIALHNNLKMRQSFGQNLRQKVQLTFQLGTMVEKTLALYN